MWIDRNFNKSSVNDSNYLVQKRLKETKIQIKFWILDCDWVFFIRFFIIIDQKTFVIIKNKIINTKNIIGQLKRKIKTCQILPLSPVQLQCI